MSDFLLHFRFCPKKVLQRASEVLRFSPETETFKVENSFFSLVLTRSDDLKLWSPFQSESLRIGIWLAGRVAFDEPQWRSARDLQEPGGLACKAIYQAYLKGGVTALTELNGNFTVMLHDPRLERFFIVTDRCGAAPVFQPASLADDLVFCSHPDLLAETLACRDDYDLTSLGEFLATGKVSYPFTYYKGLRAAPFGTMIEVDLASSRSPSCSRYFNLNYIPDHHSTENDIAEQLAQAFRNSVQRRTLSFLGTSIISLSGGLDSRMILCAAKETASLRAISFYDEENTELKVAKRIAAARGIPHTPLQRKFEHYGDSAEAGVRISGAMTSIASNHFLGFRNRLRDLGADNLLTGCYCDYFFKALALTKSTHPLWRTERFASFGHHWYRPLFRLSPAVDSDVHARLDELFPAKLRTSLEGAILETESRRLFPLSYEPDSMQRVIPHRVLPWYLPVVDNEVLDVYLRIPASMKLNASMFSKMVALICGPEISAIPDANTNAPVNASRRRRLIGIYSKALENRFHRFVRPRLATSGSWPNWKFYLTHSETVRYLWSRPNDNAREIFQELLGYNPFERTIASWSATALELFLRLLTLKIWIDQRESPGSVTHAVDTDLATASNT